ncbi:family 78 glycoside hydrolase catalytic domain [Streptomyces sp. NPDC001027]|uniref:family 78 glycoside hydrolase catalytic domain n=1 Tax=Streptomyces sp. NPDC001027 TaxID=3154771 RepID=UPI003323A164
MAGLQVNSVTSPLGTESAPVFSWVPYVERQTAYEIQVGTAPGRWNLWNSGKVRGSDSAAVPYEGRELASRQECFWRVRSWDAEGRASRWSDTARWETGLLAGESEWGRARWIGGRQPQDHCWEDVTKTVVFRGGTAPATGLTLLLRAEPIGKTWGEALSWTLRKTESGTGMELVMATVHYAGNTWVDDGTSEPDWGHNHYDPQSETNPTATGTRTVTVATVAVSVDTGLTVDSWGSRDHTVVIQAKGLSVTTTVNGVHVDSRTLKEDQIRRRGSIGFGAGSSAVVRKVKVTGTGAADFSCDLAGGANPFESGISTAGGLTFVAKNAMLPIANPAPLLRKTADLAHGDIATARLYLSAAGNVTFTINGEPLTTDGRKPAKDQSNIPRLLTDHSTYDRTVFYDTFDVTRLVHAGRENALAAELGRGWYGVTTPQEWYWHLAPYVGAPRMRAMLVVTYRDGRTTTVSTDASWQTADGPTLFDSVYSGEKYDARRAAELGDWRAASHRARSRWQPATVLTAPGSCQSTAPKYHGTLPATTVPEGFTPARVRAHEAEPVVVNQTLHARTLRRAAPDADVWIVDFGQILTGFPLLSLSGVPRASAGLTLRMSGANKVSGKGTADVPLTLVEENVFHDANLQTNYYTLDSSARQTWEPQFHHWGFRYMEVRHLEAVLGRPVQSERDLSLFSVHVARSGFARTGVFTTDNALINRIQHNLEWAEQNNLVQKPTDTPSREKNGWTGDTMASSESQLLTWDVNAAFTKYLRGFPDGQISTGQLPMILPAAKGGYGYDHTPGWSKTWKAVPAWDSAYFVIPRELHRYYGNSTLYAELYDHQDALLITYESLFTEANGYRFTASLGAYSGAEAPGDNAVISLAFYIHFCDYMDEVGELLGKTSRARHYRTLAGTLRRAFIANYWDTGKNCFTKGSLSSENTLAIAFDLVPGSDLPTNDPRHLSGTRTLAQNKKALARLLADRLVAADHHIQNDMYGSRYEFNILDEYGYTDIALKAVTQPGYPGYVNQIAQGATSLWENWEVVVEGARLEGSVNHHYRSSVATWFYQGLAGIQPTSTAYETLRIRPYIPTIAVNSKVPASTTDTSLEPAPLNHVAATLDTVRGTVASHWTRRDDGRIHLKVTVPYNTLAEIWVPTQGNSVTAPKSAAFVREDTSGGKPYRIYRATAGTHHFNTPRPW